MHLCAGADVQFHVVLWGGSVVADLYNTLYFSEQGNVEAKDKWG